MLISATLIYYGRRPDDAILQSLKIREIDPNFPLANSMLAAAYEEKGDLSSAAAQFRELGDSVSLAVLQARQGNPSTARQLQTQLNTAKQSPYPLTMMRLSVALGDKAAAIKWLNTAYQEHAHWLIWLRVDPKYDDLRSDPRFQELLRMMRFPV
jgi:hypothetical protein